MYLEFKREKDRKTDPDLSRSREIFSIFMETDGHHTICRVESLFHTVSMVAIDVDVQHARECAQKLENGKYDIVNVAETGCFAFFGVVQATSPVDGDVGRAGGDVLRSVCDRFTYN